MERLPIGTNKKRGQRAQHQEERVEWGSRRRQLFAE